MGMLIWSLIAFVGTHFLMSHPLRAPMVGRFGEVAFQGIYTLVSLLSFGWVIYAFQAAPRGIDFWPVTEAMWIIASLLMLVGSIFFTGSFFGNPALPTPSAADAARAPARGVFAITRHPMMWGFALWGLVHALIAPYQASLILCAGMIILAIGGSAGQDRKKARLMGDAWTDWCRRTSFLPFANQLTGRAPLASLWPGRTAFLSGVALWLGASYLHPQLGGPVVGLWRWL
jgi:uncharacterized membrane protein